MLLVIDVGNTHFTLGLYDGDALKATFRMTAKQPRTSDEYGIQLCGLLEHRDFKVKEVDAVIISSVVPDIMHSLGSAIIKYFGVKPYVPSTLDMGLKINTEHPKEVGPDRIVDAAGLLCIDGHRNVKPCEKNISVVCHDFFNLRKDFIFKAD